MFQKYGTGEIIAAQPPVDPDQDEDAVTETIDRRDQEALVDEDQAEE